MTDQVISIISVTQSEFFFNKNIRIIFRHFSNFSANFIFSYIVKIVRCQMPPKDNSCNTMTPFKISHIIRLFRTIISKTAIFRMIHGPFISKCLISHIQIFFFFCIGRQTRQCVHNSGTSMGKSSKQSIIADVRPANALCPLNVYAYSMRDQIIACFFCHIQIDRIFLQIIHIQTG